MLTCLSWPGMLPLIVREVSDACTDFVGPGCNSTYSSVEVQVHPFTGCNQETLLGVIHALELVNALVIESEYLRRHNIGIALDDLALPRDVGFDSDRRTAVCP